MRWFALFAVVASGCSSGGGNGDGGGGGGGGDGSGGGAGAAQLCVDTINMYRATLNLAPYARWTDQEACADGQAASDSMTMKAHGAFGMCTEGAQNECPNWSGPPEMLLKGCLASMWAEGPGTDFSKHGHYINMSSTKYTKVACGFHQTSTGKYWAVQDFR
jgi:hypothetical protein